MNKNQKSIRRVARATRNNEGVTRVDVTVTRVAGRDINTHTRTVSIRREAPVKRAACKVAGPNARKIGEQVRLQKEMEAYQELKRAYKASRRLRYE